jgi:hypothetical protein
MSEETISPYCPFKTSLFNFCLFLQVPRRLFNLISYRRQTLFSLFYRFRRLFTFFDILSPPESFQFIFYRFRRLFNLIFYRRQTLFSLLYFTGSVAYLIWYPIAAKDFFSLFFTGSVAYLIRYPIAARVFLFEYFFG